MRIRTPLSRIRYKVLTNKWSYRWPKMAIKLWWKWDVLPWFKKIDYKYGHEDKPFYRWERFFRK